MHFTQYVCLYSVLKDIKAIPLAINVIPYDGLITIKAIAANDLSLTPGVTATQIYLNHAAQTFYPPFFHKLGFPWELWVMKCPMAWEITMGLPASGFQARAGKMSYLYSGFEKI